MSAAPVSEKPGSKSPEVDPLYRAVARVAQVVAGVDPDDARQVEEFLEHRLPSLPVQTRRLILDFLATAGAEPSQQQLGELAEELRRWKQRHAAEAKPAETAKKSARSAPFATAGSAAARSRASRKA